jgi:hypothetical protein
LWDGSVHGPLSSQGDIARIIQPANLPPLHEVTQAWIVQIDYVPFKGDAYGSYQNSSKTIRLATHEEKVFFHELAHAAHAGIETLKGRQDPRQETIAEFTACDLIQVYGLRDSTGCTWEYTLSK